MFSQDPKVSPSWSIIFFHKFLWAQQSIWISQLVPEVEEVFLMMPDEVKSLKAVGLQSYCIKAKVGIDVFLSKCMFERVLEILIS